MAHFILQYSGNLNATDETIQELFCALHKAAEDTGLFPLKGLRSRAYCCHQYRLADGNPNHGFAHLEVKLGAGRSLQQRQDVAEKIFTVFTHHFDAQMQHQGVALSFEMQELDPILKYNKNNIQDYL